MVEWQTRRTQNAMPRGVPVQVRPRVSSKKDTTSVVSFFVFKFNFIFCDKVNERSRVERRKGMPLIEHQEFIKAPIERCFDLARDVDVHTQTTAHTRRKL